MDKERKKIDSNYKWDLTKIYKTEEEIKNDIKKIKELTKELVNYKGKLTNSSSTLYEAIDLYYNITRILDKLVVYSNMKLHEDMNVAKSQVLVGKIDKLTDEIAFTLSFFTSELLKNDYTLIEKYIKENPKLLKYQFSLKDIFREKKYILSEEKEQMLAKLGEIFNISSNVFDMLDAVDLTFSPIKINDKVLNLNQSNFTVYLKDEDRNIRKQAFYNYYEAYQKHKNTFAATLYGEVKTNFFIAKERGYKNPLDMALHSENIDKKLYDRLINKVNERINLSHKYIKLRKKVLNLDELHMYDIYTPLVKNIENKYTYSEAKELVLKALEPLGKDYLKDLNNLFNSNIIDVYHNKGKQTGAYSWGCYDSMPYVLLNFEETFNDVSTIAHEMGHSMHSYYSNKNNSYQDSSYTIFLAEIASTVNEILLNKYCSNNAKSKEEKLFYINNLLEILRTTLIRQTMFAEFEKELYDKEEQGEILTEELISNTYYNLNKKYYGNDIVSDSEIRLEWARISHFYKCFYVYKYATGISIACKIVTDILDNKENALDNYLTLLKSGGKDYSLNLLKQVGIDILNDDTIDKALDLFDSLIDEFMNNL